MSDEDKKKRAILDRLRDMPAPDGVKRIRMKRKPVKKKPQSSTALK